MKFINVLILALLLLIITNYSLFSQNFWAKTNAPSGTQYIVYSIVSNKSGDVFAVVSNTGIYKTTDNGNTWTLCFSQYTDVRNIAIGSNGYIYVGTWGGGIYMSTTNGNSWVELNATVGWIIGSLAVSTNGYVFAYTSNAGPGILKSTDNGASWNLSLSSSDNITCITASTGGYLYAGSASGILYLSIDNGNTWNQKSTGLPGSKIAVISIDNTGNVFAGFPGYQGIFESTDNGTNWTQINNNLSDKRVNGIAIDSNNILFVGTPSGCYISFDHGSNWNLINNGFLNDATITKFVRSIIVTPNNNVFAGMDGDGIYRTSNSTSSIVLLTTPNGGENWQAGTNQNVKWLNSNITNVKLEYSTDNGANWTTIISSYPANSNSYSWTNPNTPSSICLIRISDASNLIINDVSSNTFTISGLQASTITNSTTNITQTSATLNGIVNPNGSSTTVQFDYGTTTSYGTSITATQSPVSGDTNVSVSANITGLTPNTLYHFRVEATNSAGTNYGADSTFNTLITGEYKTDANTILLLHMDELNGSTVGDASGLGFNGTTSGSQITQGRFGNARRMTESGDYITIPPQKIFNPGTEFTAEAWIKYDTVKGSTSSIIHNSTGFGFNILPASSDKSTCYNYVRLYIGGSYVDSYGGITFRKGTWNHLAFVLKNNVITTYINGVVAFQSSYTGTVNVSSNPLIVGAFSGTIDEVRISNKARSPEEFNLQLPPINLNGNVVGKTVNLSWQNGGGAIGLLRYKIYKGTDSTNVILIDSTNSTSYIDTNITKAPTYYYKVSPVDSSGFESSMSYAAIIKTGFGSPIVTTLKASNLSFTTASLNGIVNPIGTNTIVGFDYGTTSSYGSTATAFQSPLSGNNNVNVNADITGLTPNTLYHYRVRATNNVGTTYGADSTFTTLNVQSKPTATTENATSINMTSSILNGIVNANGLNSTAQFDYGSTTNYGSSITATQSPLIGNSDISVSANITGLTPNTLYHYRIEATNSAGTSYGADSTFTTKSTLPSPGSWLSLANMPGARITPFAAAINGVIYVAGGDNGTSDDATLQEYAISSNTWTTGASMPGGRYQGDGAAVINGKMYVTGGWTTAGRLPNSNLWSYNPASNSWATLANTPTLAGGGASEAINGKLYVTTGEDGNSGYRNYLWVYDTTQNAWSTLASSPDACSQSAYGVINNKFYVAGGYNSSAQVSNQTYVYDPANNTWTTLAPMPTPISSPYSGVINGKLYVAGGYNGSNFVSSVEVYNPSSNTWTTDTPMLSARSGGASVVYNGILYAIGGTNGVGPMSLVEAYMPTNSPASVVTNSAINITQTSATLNGTVNANGLTTAVHFDYGTTSSYGDSVTANPSTITGTSNISVTATISGLTPNTVYHFRVEASDSAGMSYGYDSTFTTLSVQSSPFVSTQSANNISDTSSTLNAIINPNGANSEVKFEYGITSAYGDSALPAQNSFSGNSNTNVSVSISGLTPNTLYHYRADATNSAGTSYGADSTFRTISKILKPIVTTESATNITPNSSKLVGIVNPNGSLTNVQFEYGTTTSYGTSITASQSPVTSSSNVNVSANISSLIPGITYHFRVEATNSAGTSYGADSTFTTLNVQSIPTATTENATNITTNSSTLNGLVNANGASSTVQFDYGTTTGYGSSKSASQSPIGSDTNTSVSANITGLTPNTLYHYRIEATNSTGTSYGSDSTFNTLQALPTVTTNNPTEVNVNTAILNAFVNSNGSNSNVRFDYGTTSSYGSSIAATPSTVYGNSNTSVYAGISGLNSNTLYHYRIEATNSGGTSYGSDISFQTFSTTTSITYSYTFGGDITNTNNYEIIGIPGNSSLMLSSVLSGTESQDWVAYYDNGAVNNYLVEFDNSSLFEFSPGNGFWILSKNPISLSQTVPNVSLDSKGNYSIPLHAGWNIISNPFSAACIWDSVISLNGLSSNAVIYNWNNGNWQTASVFTPYIGYYFYNSSNLSSLTIPYNATGKLSKISVTNTNEQNHTTIATGEQVIKISLISNGIKTSSAYAEINPKSIAGYDQYDLLSPPSDFNEESLTLINDSLALSYKNLIIDSRPAIGDGMAFNIAVTNKQEGQLSLNFSGLSSFNNYECYLMDNNSKEFFDLNNKSNISIRSSKASGYELFIGNKDYIEKQMEANAPSSYYLYQNYPNPFNPSTVIRYALSFNSNIKIELYNILGERVKELINGEKEAGFHELNFNATGLASGVYFYTIEARSIDGKKEFRDTKKMVLLK